MHLLYAAEFGRVISKAKERSNNTASAQKSAYVSSHLNTAIYLCSFISRSCRTHITQTLTLFWCYLNGNHVPIMYAWLHWRYQMKAHAIEVLCRDMDHHLISKILA